MTSFSRAIGVLALTALCACAQERHPLDLHLSRLQPETVTSLPDMGWPAGTLLCPMTPYQSKLLDSTPAAGRVNAFLKQKQFLGEEGQWALIVVRPEAAGNAGIEQLVFRRGMYDVINDPGLLRRDGAAAPAQFLPQSCVPVERARVLATRPPGSDRTMIVFGTQ